MRTAAICPTCATYENALCVLYNGEYLPAIDVAPLDSLEVALEKINSAITELPEPAYISLSYSGTKPILTLPSIVAPNLTYVTDQVATGEVWADFTFNNFTAIAGTTSLGFPNLQGFVSYETLGSTFSTSDLVSLSMPNLKVVLASQFSIQATALTALNLNSLINAQMLSFSNLNSLAFLNLPVLNYVKSFNVSTSPGLANISINSLVKCYGNITINNCAFLDTITLSNSIIEFAGNFTATTCALTQVTVDNILVKLAALNGTGGTVSYDNKTVNLSGGTNATPSATGLAAKAVLQARGCTVTHN